MENCRSAKVHQSVAMGRTNGSFTTANSSAYEGLCRTQQQQEVVVSPSRNLEQGTLSTEATQQQQRHSKEVILKKRVPTRRRGDATKRWLGLHALANSMRRGEVLVVVIAVLIFCDIVSAHYSVMPVSSNDLAAEDSRSRGSGAAFNLGEVSGVAEGFQDRVEPTMDLSEAEKKRIQDLVLKGLNITRIPRAAEINISQKEYEEKYRLYLELTNTATERRRRNSPEMMSLPHAVDEDGETDIRTLVTIRPNASFPAMRRNRRSTVHSKDVIFVRFPLSSDDKMSAGVDEATLRLLLVRQPSHQKHQHREIPIHVNVFQLTAKSGRILLDTLIVDATSIGHVGKWVEFNVRPAVHSWIDEEDSNLGFEIHCGGCDKQGVQVEHEHSDVSSTDTYFGDEDGGGDGENLRPLMSSSPFVEDGSPALNIVSRTRSRGKRSRVVRPYSNRLHSRRPHHTKCEEHNGQKCCRSEMTVVFRDLKALDFIIQPKVFDAGYCRGKCPFNYNVASNHAYLQGMIWRQDRKKVPRPCCAPKKLEDLQVLHIDEENPTKLKVSTWPEMKVLECACS